MEKSSNKTPPWKIILLTVLSIGLGAGVTNMVCKNDTARTLTELAAHVKLQDAKRAQQELELMRQRRYACVQQFLRMRAEISPESILASELDVATGRMSQMTFDLIKKMQVDNDNFLKTFAASDFDCSK